MSIARIVFALAALSGIPVVSQAEVTAAGSTPGSFRVTESGAAEYRIPIRVPPGIAGMEPKLALVYSSQSRNGLLGVGWNLEGLSAITRCPQTVSQDGPGPKPGVNYTASDRFCMDGQRLIAIAGAYGADGTEYRTERESFTKVVSYGVAGNGPAWFKAWTKSGQIFEYGNTDGSRVEAQGRPSVRIWAVSKVSDTKGNYFTVSYDEDNQNGDFHPARLDYTGNAVAGSSPAASVQFEYQPRPDVTPAYVAGSVSKAMHLPAAVRVYAGVAIVKEYRLLYHRSGATQESVLASVAECTAEGACLPATSFQYEESAARLGTRVASSYLDTHFEGYELVTGDFNGDGKLDLLYITDGSLGPPYGKGQQLSLFLSNGDGTFGPRIATSYTDTHFAGYQLVTGDFNGDGKTDLMYVTDGSREPPYGKGQQRSIFLSNGDGSFGPRVATYYTDTHFGAYQLVMGDFDGDGRTDMLYVTDGSLGPPYGKGQQRSVFLSNGDGTFGPRVATSYPDTHFGAYELVTGDFNGDGMMDLLYVTDGSLGPPYGKGQQRSVFLSGGGGTFGPRVATSYPDTHFGAYQLVSGDFNGDGMTDLLYITDGAEGPPYGKGQRRSVFLSNGDGSFGPRTATSYTDTHFAGYQLMTGDFNGDGKTDLLYITDGSLAPPYGKGQQRSIFPGNGDGSFGARIASDYPDTHFAAYQLLSGDFNGDGKSDIAYVSDGSQGIPYGKGQQRSVFHAAPEMLAPDLVSRVTDGLGRLISVTHKPISDNSIYAKDSTAIYPMRDLQGSLYVAAAVDTTDGVGANLRVSYLYAGAKTDLAGRGFAGFRQMQAVNAATGVTVTGVNRQEWPYVGLPALARTTQSSGLVLSEQANTLSCIDPATGFACAVAFGNRYFPFISKSVETGGDLNGAPLPTVTTSTAYDLFGNAESVAVSTGDGFSKATTNVYTNDVPNWLLGRLKSSTVQSTMPVP